MANKFNSFGFGGQLDPTNGSLHILGKSLSSTGLAPDSALLTDSNSRIVSTSLITFTPSGPDGAIQFNNGGTHGGEAAMNFNDVTKTVTFNTLTIDINGDIFNAGETFLHLPGATTNLGIGHFTGTAVTTANNNVFCGFAAGQDVTEGSLNVFVGSLAGVQTTIAAECVFVGYTAGENNISGSFNTFVGKSAGRDNTTGTTNVFVGRMAGTSSNGSGSVAIGASAMNVSTGSRMLIIGASAALNMTTADEVVAIGESCLKTNTITSFVVAIGTRALQNATAPTQCTAIGHESLTVQTSAIENTTLGFKTGLVLTTSPANTLIGNLSGSSITTGLGESTLVGNKAGAAVTIGVGNTFVGNNTGTLITTGSNSVFIGNDAGSVVGLAQSDNIMIGHVGVAGDTKQIRLGTTAVQTDIDFYGAIQFTSTGDIFRNGVTFLHTPTGTSGVDNIAVGKDCMKSITSGGSNTGQGADCLEFLTSGFSNTCTGKFAGNQMTTGNANAIYGEATGQNITEGERNTMFGRASGSQLTVGDANTFLGNVAGQGASTANECVATGSEALFTNSTISNVVAYGTRALRVATLPAGCTAIGHESLLAQTTATLNTTLGFQTGLVLTTSSANTFLGNLSGSSATTGTGENTFAGKSSGANVTTGTKTVIVGANSGGNLTTTSSNIIIGNDIPGVVTDVGVITIGNSVTATKALYHGIHGVTPSGGSIFNMVIDTNGQVGATVAVNGAPVLPTNFIEGIVVSDNISSRKRLSIGSCRDSTDVFDIIQANGSLDIDIKSNGAGALDTGTEAADTWYAIYVIADTAEVNVVESLFSLSATAPTLPSGYDVFRRVGWARNNTASDFYEYDTFSTGRERFYLWNEEAGVTELLTNGAAVVWTNVDISELVPPTSQVVYLNMNHIAGNEEDFASVRTAGLTGTDPTTNPRGHRCYGGRSSTGGGGLSGASTCYHVVTDSTQNIEYANSSADELTDIWILGFTDFI